jgi:hypothetical protein
MSMALGLHGDRVAGAALEGLSTSFRLEYTFSERTLCRETGGSAKSLHCNLTKEAVCFPCVVVVLYNSIKVREKKRYAGFLRF